VQAGGNARARAPMTASECLVALKHGLLHISRQRGLTLAQRLWLAALKCVAILGYYTGKARSFRAPGGTPAPAPDVPVRQLTRCAPSGEPCVRTALPPGLSWRGCPAQ